MYAYVQTAPSDPGGLYTEVQGHVLKVKHHHYGVLCIRETASTTKLKVMCHWTARSNTLGLMKTGGHSGTDWCKYKVTLGHNQGVKRSPVNEDIESWDWTVGSWLCRFILGLCSMTAVLPCWSSMGLLAEPSAAVSKEDQLKNKHNIDMLPAWVLIQWVLPAWVLI